MNIKYAGPRAMISHHGVQFKDGKEDKYVYLMIGLQILQSIDKDYGQYKSYSYDLSTKRLTDTQMMEIMQSYENDLKEDITAEEKNYTQKINEEIEQINLRTNLKDIEKQVWVNNIKVMTGYRIQRAVNKIYYMHCIKYIRAVIKRENIKEIDTPFYEKYWHVLQTIQGSLGEGRDSVQTKLEIISDENNNMIAKLFIG